MKNTAQSNPNNRSKLFAYAMLVITLILWLCVSAVEDTASIFIFNIIFTATMLYLCSIISTEKSNSHEVKLLFCASLLLRSIVSIIALYSSPDPAFAYATGTNEDSISFFERSFLPFQDVILAFEEPGFPVANYYISQFSEKLGGAHYLANVQLVLAFGSLFPSVAYAFISEIYNIKVARIAGWILVFHPLAIAFSTGLMRDALIGTLGWLLVYMALRVRHTKGLKLIMPFVVIIVCAGALYSLRVLSCAAFIVLGVSIFVAYSMNTRKMTWAQLRIITLVIVITTALLVAVVITRGERLLTAFAYGEVVRAGRHTAKGAELNPDGITTKIGNASPLFLAALAPTQIMQPLPFYSWKPPEWIGGPPRLVDILMGFGGLVNQLFMCMYLMGLLYWWRTRHWAGIIFGGVFIFVMSAANLIGLGQVRYIMAHVYPVYFLTVATGWLFLKQSCVKEWKVWGLWVICLLLVYFAYLLYQNGISLMQLAMSLGLILMVVFAMLLNYLYASCQCGRSKSNA
jgi:hypothetical protein